MSTVTRQAAPVGQQPARPRRRPAARGARGAGHLRRLVVGAVGSATLAVAAVLLPPGGAAAARPGLILAPDKVAGPVTIEAAEGALDRAYRAAEVAAEQANQADAALALVQRRLGDARAAVTVRERAVAHLRVELGSQAAATYRSADLGLTTQLLVAGDPDTFLRALGTSRALRDQQHDRLAGLQATAGQLRARQVQLAAEEGADRVAQARRVTDRAALGRAVAAARTVVDSLSRQQRAEIAARAAATAAADRALATTLVTTTSTPVATTPTLAATAAAGSRAATSTAPPTPRRSVDAAASGLGATPADGATARDAGPGSNSRIRATGADDHVPDIGPPPGVSTADSASAGSPARISPQGGGQVGVGPPAGPGVARVDAAIRRVLAYAAGHVGDRYVWGASGPDTFDCSGLTSQAWARAGVTLPRTAADQARSGLLVGRGDLRPGDLVFFYQPISHVGIYLGNGLMINASNPRTGVRISPVFTSAYVGAVRPG